MVTGWDLGIDDYTAIWFAQVIDNNRLRIIDYYECQNLGAKEIFLVSCGDVSLLLLLPRSAVNCGPIYFYLSAFRL